MPGISFTCAQSNGTSIRLAGTRQARRGVPALAAADRAADQHAVLAAGDPPAQFLAQRVGEAEIRHREQPARTDPPVADRAVRAKPPRTEEVRPPINTDHRSRTSSMLRIHAYAARVAS
jgi:hypothetical protein